MDSEKFLMEELQALQKKLGKKQSFEEAVSSIQSLVRDYYASSSPSLRQSASFPLFPVYFDVILDMGFEIDIQLC